MVNLGDFVDLCNGESLLVKGLRDGENTTIRRNIQLLLEGFERFELVRRLEPSDRRIHHTQRLLEGFFHGATNTHDFSNTLHGRSDFPTNMLEFGHIPTRNLGDDVIQTGLEGSLSLLGHGVDDLGHRDSQTKLGSDKGQWVTSSLGSQGGRSRKTSIDFDNAVSHGCRVECILNVTFSDDSQVSNNL